MEFFVAHNHLDRKLAHEVKDRIEELNWSAFVAHDDIEPSEEWRAEIIRRLQNCDALVALATDNFQKSNYANQEVGFVMVRKRPIITLNLTTEDKPLPGFLRDFQAISASESTLGDAVLKAVRVAEQKIEAGYVRPKRVDSVSEIVDSIVGRGRDPYLRVLVRPGGLYNNTIPASKENDEWLYSNRPKQLLDLTEARPTPNGLSFKPKWGPAYAEVADTGEICYGETIRGVDGVRLGRIMIVLGQILGFAIRTYERFGYNKDHLGNLTVEVRLGNVHGQELRDDEIKLRYVGTYATDQEEITVSTVPAIEKYLMTKPVLDTVETIILRLSRNFGLAMNTKEVRDLISAVFRLNEIAF